MAEAPRPAPRGAGRGYGGYDRHGNYDPYGDLLPFAEAGEAGEAGEVAQAASRGRRGWPAAGDELGAPGGYAAHGYAAAYDFEDSLGDTRSRSRTAAPTRTRAASSSSDVGTAETGARRAPTRRDTSTTAATPTTPGAPLLHRAPAWTAPAALILGPALGILLGQALGAYAGPGFAVVTVLAAMLAAASASRRGLWWTVPAAPPAIWLAGSAAELTLHDPGYVGAKAQAVGLLHATVHAFPVMAAALVASLLVVLAGRVLPGRRDAAHA